MHFLRSCCHRSGNLDSIPSNILPSLILTLYTPHPHTQPCDHDLPSPFYSFNNIPAFPLHVLIPLNPLQYSATLTHINPTMLYLLYLHCPPSRTSRLHEFLPLCTLILNMADLRRARDSRCRTLRRLRRRRSRLAPLGTHANPTSRNGNEEYCKPT